MTHSTPRPAIILPVNAEHPEAWGALGADLLRHAETLDGHVGYWVGSLYGCESVGWNADDLFPTASTIKTAILVAAMREVDAGRLRWSDTQPVPPPERRELSPWAWFFPTGQTLDLDAWLNLMIGYSDNTATIVLRDWLGARRVNDALDELGLAHTRLLSGCDPTDRELSALRSRYGMGVTTPREMGRLLQMLALGQVASPAATERMLRMLSHQYWDNLIATAVPPTVVCASKSGFIARSRSDTAIVFGPTPFVAAFYTSRLGDASWGLCNAAMRWIREAARLCWVHLAPELPYERPEGWERFLPTGGGFDPEV
ncbi:MAG: class A beta-lactamase-related serine hydrolase [Fimbriimonadales bacterium]|nr:class A beta-lactamase-related serine hydrolase [Fimbriimonadales bacterium]